MRTVPLVIAALLPSVLAQQTFPKWCGKYYQIGAPMDIPVASDAFFPYPSTSSAELLDFQCATASSFYLEGDEANDPPQIIIDANITHDIGSACE
jgi:hypothetical protein